MPWKMLMITVLSVIALVVLVVVTGQWRWSAETHGILNRLDDAYQPLNEGVTIHPFRPHQWVFNHPYSNGLHTGNGRIPLEINHPAA